MRTCGPGVALLALVLALSALLSGCVVGGPAPTSSPTSVPITRSPAPLVVTTTADPSSAAEDLQNEAVASLVEENGQTACDVLALKPATDVNELVDLIVSTYGVETMDDDSQRALVGQFMVEAAAAYCPEQSARVMADLNAD